MFNSLILKTVKRKLEYYWLTLHKVQRVVKLDRLYYRHSDNEFGNTT